MATHTQDQGVLSMSGPQATSANEGFVDDLDMDHKDRVELVEQEGETRRVDLARLLTFVQVKTARSEQGRKFVLFLIFLVLYIAAIIIQKDPYQTQTMVEAFKGYFTTATFRDPITFELKSFFDVVTLDDMWWWVQMVFLQKLYVKSWYNGQLFEGQEQNTILLHNRLTSGFRMTQRRVLNGSNTFCFERPEFEVFSANCYGKILVDGRVGDVDESPFFSQDGRVKYEYEEKDAGFGSWFDIDVGYFQEFGFNETDSQIRINDLRQNLWVNEGTGWLRLDFITYNPNIGKFAHIRFIFEMLSTGEIRPVFEADFLPASSYATFPDFMRAVLEVVATALWFYFTIAFIRQFISEAYRTGKVLSHLKSFDNLTELIQLCLFVAVASIWAVIINFPVRGEMKVTTESIVDDKGFQPNFSSLNWTTTNYNILNACNILLALIRILSYMRVNPNISQLTETFDKSRENLAQFGLVLLVLIVAFQLMSHLMFGAKLKEFADFGDGFINTVETMLGNGDYYELSGTDEIAAPLFYYPFIFVMVLVVFNMTIAIIMDGYAASKEERDEAKKGHMADLHTKNVFLQFTNGFMRWIAPISFLLPNFLRWRKLDNLEYDRYLAPDKFKTLKLLEAVRAYKSRYIIFNEFRDLIQTANPGTPTADIVFIVDRYHSWEDITLRLAEEEEERRRELMIETVKQLDLVEEKVAIITNNQLQLGAKIDMIMRSFVIAEKGRC